MNSSEITRQAKSNLAFALHILPRERRDDMIVFYAFCRVIDDIADEESMPVEQRITELNAWKNGIVHGFDQPTDFQSEVATLQKKYQIPADLLTAIIDGCMMDTRPQRFATWEDLQGYTWKVACAVGLISIELFGATDPQAKEYAVALGHALQLTNILRDVGEDLDNGGRIYLPLDDLAKFQLTEQDLLAKTYDQRFISMMHFQASRAQMLYADACRLLPKSDQKFLVAAEVMHEIYQTVLDQMIADRFRVFEKRYALSKFHKMAILAKHLMF
jgi:phytoene synthase